MKSTITVFTSWAEFINSSRRYFVAMTRTWCPRPAYCTPLGTDWNRFRFVLMTKVRAAAFPACRPSYTSSSHLAIIKVLLMFKSFRLYTHSSRTSSSVWVFLLPVHLLRQGVENYCPLHYEVSDYTWVTPWNFRSYTLGALKNWKWLNLLWNEKNVQFLLLNTVCSVLLTFRIEKLTPKDRCVARICTGCNHIYFYLAHEMTLLLGKCGLA